MFLDLRMKPELLQQTQVYSSQNSSVATGMLAFNVWNSGGDREMMAVQEGVSTFFSSLKSLNILDEMSVHFPAT